MNLYIKQKVFSWADKFDIYDADGNPLYNARGEVFTFGKKLHLYDMDGNELAFIHQKMFSFRPKYLISRNGEDVAEVTREFGLLKPRYSVEGLGWDVQGNYFAHEYEISENGGTIASISKKWFTWGDTYEVNTENDNDAVMALCVVLVIDAVLQQDEDSQMMTNNN